VPALSVAARIVLFLTARAFIAQWTDPTARKRMRETIGIWGAITPDQASTAARALLGAVAKGGNPRTEREKAKAAAEQERRDTALTLDALISEWAFLHLANRRPTYRAEAQAIRDAFVGFLKRPASRLSRADVVGVLDRIASDGKAAMPAGRWPARGPAFLGPSSAASWRQIHFKSCRSARARKAAIAC